MSAYPYLVTSSRSSGRLSLVGSNVLEPLRPPPLPVLDEIAEELAAPADAAFEEGETQVWEPSGHAAEEQGLGHVVAGRGEVTDVVEREVGRAVALAIGAAAGVKGRRDRELAALLPERVVIVFTVEAELIEAQRIAGDVGGGVLGARNRPAHAAAEHTDLRTELLGDERQFLDRLFRCVHRDHRYRDEPVAEVLEVLVGDDVEAADHRAPRRVVGDARNAEPRGRVDDAEIDAELFKPVVQHPGHHGRRAVARVGRLPAPEPLHRDTAFGALGEGQAERIRNAPLRLQEPVGAEVAGDLADLLGKDGRVLDPVSVAVDDGVREALSNFLGRCVRAHPAPPRNSEVRSRVSLCPARNRSQTPSPIIRTRAAQSSESQTSWSFWFE